MDKIIFPEIADPQRRRQMIEDNCDVVLENHEYKRQFEPEEIETMQVSLSESLIKLQVLEEKLATYKSDFKDQMDPIKDLVKQTIAKIREGAERKTGVCFGFKDLDTNEFGVYSPEGYLVSVPRRLKPDEGLQKTIKMSPKEGTNN